MKLKKSDEDRANDISAELSQILKGVDFLPDGVYKLLTEISPITCVDMIPCRWHEGKWQVGLITRNTGFFKDKLWIIGGRVNIGESIQAALDRNMKSDLMIGMNLFPGLAWNKPFLTLQYYHNPENYREPYHLPNFGHEHSKHCIALTYLVLIGDDKEVHFGSTEHGGQEANDFNWFDIDGIPPKEMIAYGGRETTLIPASQFLNEKYPNGA